MNREYLSKKSNLPVLSTLFFASLLVVSMIFSPFLLSISMWGLVFTGIGFNLVELKSRNILRAIAAGFVRWWKRPDLVALSLLFLVPAISGFWSEDSHEWLVRTRVRIPFFVLPWAFANLPALDKQQLRIPIYVLILTLVVTCIGIGINYALNYEAVMDMLKKGQPVPVPRHHIRFNLIVVTAVLAGIWILWKEGRKVWLLLATLFLFGFLHVLSVRSGLAAMYGALVFAAVYFIWTSKKWGLGLLFLVGLGAGLVASAKYIPSLAQRISYMRYDWEQFSSGKGGGYSDSERLISLQVGYTIWKHRPATGVGAGDLKMECERLTVLLFPGYPETGKLPHNQIIYILAGTGIFGMLLSLWAFLYPVFYKRRYRHPLFAVFQLVVLASFMVEYTIETAIGVAFYIFYTLWFIKIADQESA